jgi:hypothetical protein
MTFDVKTSLFSLSISLLQFSMNGIKDRTLAAEDANAISAFCKSIHSFAEDPTNPAALDSLRESWGGLPFWLRCKVTEFASDHSCVAAVESILGALPPPEK